MTAILGLFGKTLRFQHALFYGRTSTNLGERKKKHRPAQTFLAQFMVKMVSMTLFLCLTASLFCLLHASNVPHKYTTTLFGSERRYERALTKACEGDLYTALELIMGFNDAVPSKSASAGGLHIESALQYILHANVSTAVALHKQAKTINATLVPPLAALYLAQHMAAEPSQSTPTAACPGLGDMFYVSAVSIKQIADNHTQVLLYLHPLFKSLVQSPVKSHQTIAANH